MAVIRRWFQIGAACLALTGCGALDSNDAVSVAIGAVGNVFNQPERQPLTATRASLLDAGFDQSLLVITLRNPDEFRVGLLDVGENQGVTFWRGADSATLKTDQGVMRGTIGLGHDLQGADTAPTLSALARASSVPYARVYRHLNSLNQLDSTRFFCELSAPVPETIVVFDRSHRTLRFTERCTADRPDPVGRVLEIENTYWRDVSRVFLWRSDQWISREIGNMLLERVFE